MANPPMDEARVKSTLETFRQAAGNVSETARRLGISRRCVRDRLAFAERWGWMEPEERAGGNTSSAALLADARARKLKAYAKKKAKGDWRKASLVHLPQQPFRLKLFGDPHLDDDGCDYELFERHWLEMDATAGVYGVCIGDWFNNWTKSLAHLWKESGDPSDAWVLFEHLMEQRGEALIGGCSGNHDDWTHAPADPIDMLMKRHGVRYRRGAIRLLLDFGQNSYTIALRHKWHGNSMYSAAHGLKKAALFGWNDDLMVGGHIHQDEPRMHVHPDTGAISRLCQISAFKRFDEYADTHGFMSNAFSPVWDLVINPYRSRSDPERTVVMWDSEAAADRLAFERRKVAA